MYGDFKPYSPPVSSPPPPPFMHGGERVRVQTHEHQAAMEAFAQRINMLNPAFAGAGKTSLLEDMTNSTPRRGRAFVFNRTAANELTERLSPSCKSSTFHSPAWIYCHYGLNIPKVRLNKKFIPATYEPLLNTLVGHPLKLLFLRLVGNGLRNFHQSADPYPMPHHVPEPNRLTVDTSKHLDAVNSLAYQVNALSWISQIWSEQQIIGEHGKLLVGGDAYLKIWAVSNPRINADYMLVDEAQDTNKVVHGIIAAQQCQIIIVGDRHQQIYAWRGAENALAAFPFREFPLSQSWRFGPELAAQATAVLYQLGEARPLLGNPARSTLIESYGGAEAAICRTNAGCFAEAAAARSSGRNVYADWKLVKELEKVNEDIIRLENGEAAVSDDLFGITSFEQLKEFSETEDGSDFKTIVSLVGKYGCDSLGRMLASFLPKAVPGCLSVATVHKAKGLEWASVRLGDDFRRDHMITDEERRLLYVAITRAKTRLVVDPDLLAEYQRTTPPPKPKAERWLAVGDD